MNEPGSASEGRQQEQEGLARWAAQQGAIDGVKGEFAEERVVGVDRLAILSVVCFVAANGAFAAARVIVASADLVGLGVSKDVYRYQHPALAVSVGLVVCGVALGILTWLKGLKGLFRIGVRQGQAFMRTLSVMLSVPLVLALAVPALWAQRGALQKEICAVNIQLLGAGLKVYAEYHKGEYPPVETWADTIKWFDPPPERAFRCPAGAEGRCHYAINPYAARPLEEFKEYFVESLKHVRERPEEFKRAFRIRMQKEVEAQKLVLLFETKGGWNQFGTAEMLSFENHKGKGAHVMLANGELKFIAPEEAEKLKWRLQANNR